MDYVEKINRMEAHLKEHPHDYQTVIAKMKLTSKLYDKAMKQSRNARLKRLAEIRKQLREEDIKHGNK